MSFSPIAGTALQYMQDSVSANDHYIKFYASGTTTPISMATDNTGGTLLAKAQFNSQGYAINGSNAEFIPHIDQKYKIVFYPNATDADNNTFANAVFNIDLQEPFATLSDAAFPKNFVTLALAVADTSLVVGDALNIAERTTGNGGGGMADVVLSSSVTEDTFGIIQCTGVATLSIVIRNEGFIDVKRWGATGDGSTDDQGAIVAAIASFTTNRGGAIYFPIGAYKCSADLALDQNGLRVYGECWRGSILWYSGTGTALALNNPACVVDHMHITSLDPATSNHLVGDNAGAGTGAVGIALNHVDAHVHHNTLSYFNEPSLFSSAVRTTNSITLGFSNTVEKNYIRYCWGGISLQGTNTDTLVFDNSILDVEKYGVSVGYNWATATQSGLTGDNCRIWCNLIQNVNKNKSPGGGVGDGYAIALWRGSTTDVRGNYGENYDAAVGSTAYGIYVDGVSSGAMMLATEINSNNMVTNSSETKFSLFVTNAWYGGGAGNHFDSGAGAAEFSTDSKWFEMGVNFFTGGNSAPWTIGGTANRAFNAILNRIETNSGNVMDIDYGLRFNSRNFDKQFTLTPDSTAPSVTAGNLYITANTVNTLYNNFTGTDGQTITIIFKDANSDVDFSSSSLKGNSGVDWTTIKSGDSMRCVKSGGIWYCDVSTNVA